YSSILSSLPAMLLFLSLLLAPHPCMAYGYSRSADPLIKSFKSAVRATRKDDWSTVQGEFKAVKWQLDELKGDLKVDFGTLLKDSIDKKNKRLIIVRWANLIYLALKQKFYWNNQEQLNNFQKAKARLAAAKFYYEVALAGNVRRYDKSKKTSLHSEIVKLFDQLRGQLGRPAVLGTKSIAADPSAFKKDSTLVVSKLKRVFPYFEQKSKKSAGKK
ncbi:MAG: hypothetical protein P1V97_10235, partial [Planctomycetota bacterium]|nr:hypothetical protein [Planctomycetota bacterium]